MEFPQQLKYIREKLVLSQHMLAEEIGVSYATINRWETGRRVPNYKTKRKFIDYCEKNCIKFEEKNER